MKILARYLATNIITTILMVILVLIGVEILIQLSQEFPDIGSGNYNLFHAVVYVFMLLPIAIYQFFPMAGLLGCLIGLGLLASRSELIVMRAAGVSITRITATVLMAALAIMLLALFLGEVIGPSLQRTATEYKASAISGGQAIRTIHGTWLRHNNNFIHIESILPHGKLKNVSRYQFDDQHNLLATSHAQEGVYSQQHKWLFKNIVTSKFTPNKITSHHYVQQQWQLKINPHLLGLINVDTDERSLPQLHAYIKYLQHSGFKTIQYDFIFWQRLLQPIATLVMILLAIPFIFGPLRTVPMGLRILTGTIIGLAFFILNQFAGPMSMVYAVPPIIAASLPTILMAILGGIILARTH